MSSFIFGVVVGVVINLVTALFSRKAALHILPWLLLYIFFHAAYVLFTTTEEGRRFVMAYHDWFSYIIAILAAVSVWTLIIYSVNRLDQATEERKPPTLSPEPAPTPQKEIAATSPPQWEVIDDTLREILLSPLSQNSPQGKLALLQRYAASLRRELEEAAPKDKPRRIDRLIQVLQQQLRLLPDVFQQPSNQYKEQFNAIIGEIEQLRDLARNLGH